MDAFVGIDLAIAKRKLLPVCLCTWNEDKLVPKLLAEKGVPTPPRGFGNALSVDESVVNDFANGVLQYLCNLEHHFGVTIRAVGIDAPSAPRREDIPRREAEAALDDLRISCFATPSAFEFEAIRRKVKKHLLEGRSEPTLPHAAQLWMLAGFAPFRALGAKWECIEVYPQATMRVLDVADVNKKSAAGILA